MPPHKEHLLSEFHALQSRLDELRTLLREEVVNEALPSGRTFSILLSRTEDTHIGILLRSVKEVVPRCQLTPFPDAAPWFSGLLNLGGEMVPVLDPEMRISGRRCEEKLSDLIVIGKTDAGRVGIIVRSIEGIHSVERDDVGTVSGRLAAAPYLLGTVQLDTEAVLLLDVTGLASNASVS